MSVESRAADGKAAMPCMRRRMAVASAVLAMVAGFVDAACFVGLFEVFTSHVTGNIASLASEIVHPGQGIALRFEVLVAFGIGAATARLATLLPKAAPEQAASDWVPVLACEAMWLAVLVAVHFGAGPPGQPGSLSACALIFFAGGAMGAQSAMSKLHSGLEFPTTVMTSNFTQWAIAAVDALRPVSRADRAAEKAGRRLGLLSAMLALFATGAALGAISEASFGFAAMIGPLVLVVGLLLAGIKK